MFCSILIFALAGVAYVDSQTCVTTPNVTFINTTVTLVEDVLSGRLSSPPLSSEVIAVLEQVCNQSGTVYPSLIQIDALVAACPELLNVTNLPTLHVGSLSVAGLISTFRNVSTFCGCLPSLTGVIAIDAFNASGSLTVTNSSFKYNGIIDFALWCTSPGGAVTINLPNTINTIYANRQTCNVFSYSTLVASNNVEIFDKMVKTCPTDLTGIAASFACVLDVSAQSGFINCIDAAPTTCARRDCVMTFMNTICPSDMSIAYIYAVEAIHTGTFLLNTCDSAGGVTASITLILMAAICSMFL
ncbi:hypothetical protein ACF0H5_012085 [Mactra antiquata]